MMGIYKAVENGIVRSKLLYVRGDNAIPGILLSDLGNIY